MTKIHKNKIFISKTPYEPIPLSESISLEKMIIYYDENVPVLQSDKLVLLGWAWNCLSGKHVSITDLELISENNVIEDSKHFSGRYIIIVNSQYIYGDSTHSFPIYFTESYASTSLSLISRAEEKFIPVKCDFSKPLELPPETCINGIRRLLPGEYYDFLYNKSYSLHDYLRNENETVFTLETHIQNIIKYLKMSAYGIQDTIGNDFRLMLTGGKDSRLSLLSLYSVFGKNLKSFTQKKQPFLNDKNDMNIPKVLAKKLGFNHKFTYPRKNYYSMVNDIREHAPLLYGEMQPGSTFYYYLKNNWNQIEEEYVIDNYYEIGRMHLHNPKSIIGTNSKLNYNNIRKSGYLISESSYNYFATHLANINYNLDGLDIFYFVKNFVNVANQFELIDYSHTPLLFCNSLHFFRMLLSVPEEMRAHGKFHMLLLEAMTPKSIPLPNCNKGSDTFVFKLFHFAKQIISRKLYKFLQKEQI